MSRNPNHPKKGSRITVEPIRRIRDVKAIAKLLNDNKRDRLLFLIGVNNGLRVGDLLKLQVKDVAHMKVGDTLTIKESKTGKANILVVNKTVYKAIREYLTEAGEPQGYLSQRPNGFLFASKKTKKPLKVNSVNKLVKSWCRAINLRGNYGAHTLRKTWGYLQRTRHGVGFEIIAKRYNHSNPAVTMRYLGIEDKEVHNTLMNEIG